MLPPRALLDYMYLELLNKHLHFRFTREEMDFITHPSLKHTTGNFMMLLMQQLEVMLLWEHYSYSRRGRKTQDTLKTAACTHIQKTQSNNSSWSCRVSGHLMNTSQHSLCPLSSGLVYKLGCWTLFTAHSCWTFFFFRTESNYSNVIKCKWKIFAENTRRWKN